MTGPPKIRNPRARSQMWICMSSPVPPQT